MVCATHVCENESSDHRDSACESTHGDNSTNAHSSEKEQPSPSSHNNDNGDYVTVEPELLELQILDKKVINVDEEKPQSSMVVEQAVELPAGLLEDICYPSRNDPNFVNVHCKDLECLAPQKFLRSPVMDFYIRFLQQQVPSADQISEDFHFFNTYFYKKLCDALTHNGNDKEAFWINFRNWWKSSDIFRKAYIFIPIHEDLHWSLVIICIHDKEDESGLTILHLDSLRFHSRRRIVENVKSFLEYEWNYVKQGDYSLDLPVSKQIWETFLHSINNVDIEVPQQKNDFDCGVFVLFFIKRFIEVAPQRLKKKDLGMFNKNWFRPDEASALRIKIQNTLIDLFRVGDNLLQEPIKVYGRKRKKQSKGIVDNVPVALDRLVGNTPVALRTQNQLANVGRSQYGRLYVQPDCFTPATYKKSLSFGVC
ncbi:ubiquitin-like-specific protease 1D isoform X3 [Brassica rapa]|uniref:ubiquitin-like-specific protease 1D isoform X3 n=1 Tax=Brassica campestris TaxID=3711 RepID=UPI00142D5542|nr:ubiquitin-like-specific protease 1D isoform X3 [Brassica rapa]